MTQSGSRRGGGSELPPEEAERVKAALATLWKSQFGQNRNELARALGRSGPAVGAILNGKSAPSLDTVMRVAKLMNVSEQEVRTGKSVRKLRDPLEVALAYWEGRWTDEVVARARSQITHRERLSPPAVTELLDGLQAKADK